MGQDGMTSPALRPTAVASFAMAVVRPVSGVVMGQMFDPISNATNEALTMAKKNKGASIAPAVYTVAQAEWLTATHASIDALANSPLINAAMLAISEHVTPGMLQTGRDMPDHRRAVYMAMLARVSPSTVKGQFKRAAWLWDKHADNLRAAYDQHGTAGALADMLRRLKDVGIVDQFTLDTAAGFIKPKAAEKTPLEKAKAKVATLEEAAETEAKAKADRDALASPEGRAATIAALIEVGGFTGEQ